MTVKFFDYHARFVPDREAIKRIVAEVGASDEFILKGRVEELEDRIRMLLGVGYAVGVSSGTTALSTALVAMGIGEGDEVLTPAFSFISSASAVVHTGARPVFVDVDPDTCTIRPEEIEAKLTPRTRAVIPVHLFSVMADMPAIMEEACRNGICVLEDSAVSLGARMDGAPAGTIGDVGVFSFFPAKPLGGIGDAGMIVTDDDRVAARCKMLRNHGQDPATRFYYHLVGFNARMDEIQAAFLLHRLDSFDAVVHRRAELAARYDKRLGRLAPVVKVPPPTSYKRVYYTYVIQAERRDRLRAYLAKLGIETQLYYPKPLHLQPAFSYLGYEAGDMPCAEHLSTRTLSLPLYPQMSNQQCDDVADAVESFYE